MKNFLSSLIFLTILCAPALEAMSQCRSMTKKCTPELAPFTFNGQLNSTVLAEGESAELEMSFFAGQEYRIMVCGPKYIGPLTLVIFDKNKKKIFDNKEHKEAQYWDFKVNATENYVVQVGMPLAKDTKAVDMNARGCVAILVGFKK